MALADSTQRTIRCGYDACQRVIYPGRYRQRRYCSEACKQAAYRKRKQALRFHEGVTDHLFDT